MATQQLTDECPEKIFHQFARMAKITHQSIESLGIKSLSGCKQVEKPCDESYNIKKP